MVDGDVIDFIESVFVTATKLRYVESRIDASSTYNDVMNELTEVKSRLDVIEEYLLRLWRMRERESRALSAQKAIVKDKWDKELRKAGDSIKVRLGDFVSAKDKESEANINTLEERRGQRIHEDMYSRVNECYEYLKEIQRGLNASRQDLRDIVRTFQSEPMWRRK